MKTSQNHVPSLLSSILFILTALFLFGIALLMGVAALASLMTGAQVQSQQTIFLVTFGFEGLILLVAAFFSFQKFLLKSSMEQKASWSMAGWQIAVLVVVAVASILIGYQIGEIKTISWIFLPVLTIPAVVFPLGVLLAIGTRKLSLGTRWQAWNVLGLAMTLGPLLLFALEIVVAIVIIFGVIAYIMTQPELAAKLQSLSQQIMVLGPQSEAARNLIAPLFTQPGVIVLAVIYISVLVPALEEIFKPLGVWLFAGKLESASQGFALGALSGAGYALIETVGVSGQTAAWASVLFSRIGTGLLHITTSALMGAAIVLAWRERRYLRLAGTYLLAIFLHGLWNTLAILFSFSGIADFLGQTGRLSTIQPVLAAAMGLLVVALFTILVLTNRRMRKTVPLPTIEPTTPGATVEDSLSEPPTKSQVQTPSPERDNKDAETLG